MANQIATLRALLPEIEGGGSDRIDGRSLPRDLLVAFGLTEVSSWLYFKGNPLANLQAADDLVRECGYKRSSGTSFRTENPCKFAYVWRDEEKQLHEHNAAEHPTDEPRAILAALVRARIAELEAKDV